MKDTTLYTAKWEIDIEATNQLEAARKAEAIMRRPIDGDPVQARVIDVRARNNPFWTRFDLAAPDVDVAIAPVLPPEVQFARARSWKMFLETFRPLAVRDNNYLVEPEDVPEDPDARHWWTIVDYVPDSPRLYIVPGFTRTNRLGCIQCALPWGGNPDDHPLYVYQ